MVRVCLSLTPADWHALVVTKYLDCMGANYLMHAVFVEEITVRVSIALVSPMATQSVTNAVFAMEKIHVLIAAVNLMA